MTRKSSPIQARNTILVRDIADNLAALASKQVSVPTCLELVAAARGYGSYAAYTQAVKDKTEPVDIKKAQFWLIDGKVVEPRIAALGLADELDTANLVIALRGVVDELMARFPDCSLQIELASAAFFETDIESPVFGAIQDALNPVPKTREDLVDRDLDLSIDENELVVAKVGPLPEKLGGWLRASFTGKADRDDPRGEYADPDDAISADFTARVRLQRIGKQLYAGCKAEVLTLYGHSAGNFKPDPDTDPDELAYMVDDDVVR